jgi:hypothetical protein
MAKMKKVEDTPKTLEELTTTRDNLVTEVEAKQTELAEAKYGIKFDNVANISRVMKHLDKSTSWTLKDAALIINLYDNLKLEKARIKAEDAEPTANLGAIDLNSLYKSLTSVEGTGIEAARGFITLLTNIGSQISATMQEMGDANKAIQEMHIQLAELDAAVEDASTEKVEADEVIK